MFSAKARPNSLGLFFNKLINVENVSLLILVDALTNINTLNIPYKSIIKGDAKEYSIACASIIAKVTRDRIMRQWDEVYPIYGFAKHKGYGTEEHRKIIKENGPCIIHRKTFIKNIV